MRDRGPYLNSLPDRALARRPAAHRQGARGELHADVGRDGDRTAVRRAREPRQHVPYALQGEAPDCRIA
eukprot:355482-Prymnesium_polylepis.1